MQIKDDSCEKASQKMTTNKYYMTKKILGIGNAIVDILCKVDDQFLAKNNLIKGSMSLIEEETAQKLSHLDLEKITSGGSAGNTIAALAQLGVDSALIGKVATDHFGKKFITEIEKTGASFVNENFSKNVSASSFILITPDAQRTMCTFLGCASEIDESDINEKHFEDASILYLEGYLWDGDDTIKALKKAISLAKKNNVKIAFSLSDLFCVARHKEDFLQLIENDLDILFANENEAAELSAKKDLPNFFSKNKKLIIVITKSDKGCEVYTHNDRFIIAAQKVDKLIDTTGAGDVFAAGFLYGLVNDFDLKKSASFGNILASKIIQKFGARFEESEIIELK